jgi:hypothetical protein
MAADVGSHLLVEAGGVSGFGKDVTDVFERFPAAVHEHVLLRVPLARTEAVLQEGVLQPVGHRDSPALVALRVRPLHCQKPAPKVQPGPSKGQGLCVDPEAGVGAAEDDRPERLRDLLQEPGLFLPLEEAGSAVVSLEVRSPVLRARIIVTARCAEAFLVDDAGTADERFPLISTRGHVEAAVNFILLEVLMSRFPFTLSLLITSAVLSTPPSVRASLISYDITATINGGSFNGQGFQAFFTYDTKGDASDQDSPAGVVAPVAVAFTDKDAEINVADLIGGGSTLQVEASNTYDNLPSSSLAPVVGNFAYTATFTVMVTLNGPLGVSPVSQSIVFTSGPLSGGGVTFTSINLAPSVSAVPEPSSLLLLVSGSLMVLGVCWWRQHHERVTPAAA